jgi:hypothetical protein
MRVPDNLPIDGELKEDLQRRIREVNTFLNYARTEMVKMQKEIERLGKVSGDGVLQNGPNGIILR